MARRAGPNRIGVIMTRMGDDGARALKEMSEAGARAIGHSQTSCVVYGMPAEAKPAGAVEREADLNDIAGLIARLRIEDPA